MEVSRVKENKDQERAIGLEVWDSHGSRGNTALDLEKNQIIKGRGKVGGEGCKRRRYILSIPDQGLKETANLSSCFVALCFVKMGDNLKAKEKDIRKVHRK